MRSSLRFLGSFLGHLQTSASNIALKLQELITYLVDHYSHRFAEIDYVETFKLLHIKYEQQQVRSVGVVG